MVEPIPNCTVFTSTSHECLLFLREVYYLSTMNYCLWNCILVLHVISKMNLWSNMFVYECFWKTDYLYMSQYNKVCNKKGIVYHLLRILCKSVDIDLNMLQPFWADWDLMASQNISGYIANLIWLILQTPEQTVLMCYNNAVKWILNVVLSCVKTFMEFSQTIH